MGKDREGGKGGVVLNLSSVVGLTTEKTIFCIPGYCASKHAVTALTRTFGVRQHFL